MTDYEASTPSHQHLELHDTSSLQDPTIKQRNSLHPGCFLAEELASREITINLPQATVADLITGKRRVTPEIAIELGKACGTTPRHWISLQDAYDNKSFKPAVFE